MYFENGGLIYRTENGVSDFVKECNVLLAERLKKQL
jgi:hypothetical protein